MNVFICIGINEKNGCMPYILSVYQKKKILHDDYCFV